MVGIFSRFSVKGSHRRTQSALDEGDVFAPSSEGTPTVIVPAAAPTGSHGIDVAVEFKPVEHPTEPLDNDQPIQCPLPEPSVHNDGRIWKERVSSVVQRAVETPVIQEQTLVEPGTPRTKHRTPNRLILPSVSAPEHNILKLLEECNASGISFNS